MESRHGLIPKEKLHLCMTITTITTIAHFKEWLEEKIEFLQDLPEYGVEDDHIYAQGLIDEAYDYAVELRLPECVAACRKGPMTVRLLECLNAIPDTKTIMTPPEIAEQLGTAPETVVGWIKSGQLKGSNLATDYRPRYVVTPDDLAKFLESRQLQPPVPRKAKAPQSGYRRFSE